MDGPLVLWSSARFEAIKRSLGPFLSSIGFRLDTGVSFIPVSGLTGQNLAVTSGEALRTKGLPVPSCSAPEGSDSSRASSSSPGSSNLLSPPGTSGINSNNNSQELSAKAREMLEDMGLDDILGGSGSSSNINSKATSNSSSSSNSSSNADDGLSSSWTPSPSDLTALASWYNGPSLLGALERCKPPPGRSEGLTSDKPLRMPISDVFRSQAQGLTVAGRLEGGYLLPHSRLLVVTPGPLASEHGGSSSSSSGASAAAASVSTAVTATVRNLSINGSPVPAAVSGDVADVGIGGVDEERLPPGSVLCWPSHPIKAVLKFKAQIATLPGLDMPIVPGQQFTLHALGWEEACNVTKLLRTLRSEAAAAAASDGGGRTLVNKPRLLTAGQNAIVRIRLTRAMPLETYADHRRLGRFVLRYGQTTVAAGMVLKLG